MERVYSLERIDDVLHMPVSSSVSIYTSLEDAQTAMRQAAEELFDKVTHDNIYICTANKQLFPNKLCEKITIERFDGESDTYTFQIRLHHARSKCTEDSAEEVNGNNDNILSDHIDWESNIDWSLVPVDTPVLARDYENQKWVKGYFFGVDCNRDYQYGVFTDGKTSWTADGHSYWKHCLLVRADDLKKYRKSGPCYTTINTGEDELSDCGPDGFLAGLYENQMSKKYREKEDDV